jgi:cystathionine beta-synthase
LKFKSNILEAIGNTPLVRLNRVNRGAGELYAKCEFMNPGGSIKDRIGAYMIEKAEKSGALKPGGTVVEATSGNTGMGLAIAAAIKGYQSVFVLPDKMSEEKRQNLRAFGAKVVITPSGVAPDSPNSHYSTAARIARETPNSFYANQYHNHDNRDTHYQYTGPEIWEQTDGGQFDAIVMGMGTCGTITGIGKFFKEKNPKIKIIGVDPKGSILKDLHETGKWGATERYKVEGIGEDMVPDNLDLSVIDQIVQIEDKESLLMTRALLTKEGIFSGMSSGAAVVGALRYMAQTANPGKVIVVLPDSGNRYLSKVFNDAWMIENSFLERRAENTLATMIRTLHKSPKVLYAESGDRIEDVVKKMRNEGVSQLPVMKGGKVAGTIAETALLRPLISGTIKPSDAIDSLVDNNYVMLLETDPIERLSDVFTSGKIALVAEHGQVKFILTKIDLISYLSALSGAA